MFDEELQVGMSSASGEHLVRVATGIEWDIEQGLACEASEHDGQGGSDRGRIAVDDGSGE